MKRIKQEITKSIPKLISWRQTWITFQDQMTHTDRAYKWHCMRKSGIPTFFEKIRFQQNWYVLKAKNNMQKINLHYLKQIWFYFHLANQILAWNSTKSAPLNGHYPKLQFPTYLNFSCKVTYVHNTDTAIHVHGPVV